MLGFDDKDVIKIRKGKLYTVETPHGKICVEICGDGKNATGIMAQFVPVDNNPGRVNECLIFDVDTMTGTPRMTAITDDVMKIRVKGRR